MLNLYVEQQSQRPHQVTKTIIRSTAERFYIVLILSELETD